jgi:hypothetical protein
MLCNFTKSWENKLIFYKGSFIKTISEKNLNLSIELISKIRQEKINSIIFPYNGLGNVFIEPLTSEPYIFNIFQLMNEAKNLAFDNKYEITTYKDLLSKQWETNILKEDRPGLVCSFFTHDLRFSSDYEYLSTFKALSFIFPDSNLDTNN